MAKSQTFRVNVGIVVLNDQGQVLAFERRESGKSCKDSHSGQWQFPQGGVDVGEEPSEAWARELYEETQLSADDVELLEQHPDWMVYEHPEGARRRPHQRGQAQRWFVVRIKPGASIDPITAAEHHGVEPEFCRYEWLNMDDLVQKIWPVKKPIYEELARFLKVKGYC